MKRFIAVALIGSTSLIAAAAPAAAAPANNHSPNQEESFPVVCDGVDYTLFDAPASPDHAEFTPAFVVGTNTVVIPFSFKVTSSAVALTDGTVLDGVTYNAGDTIFSESEDLTKPGKRPGARTCSFGGEGVDTFQDDNGTTVQVAFSFSGVAQAMFPNSR